MPARGDEPAAGAAPRPEDKETRRRAEKIAQDFREDRAYSALDLLVPDLILDLSVTPRAATEITRAAALRARATATRGPRVALAIAEKLGSLGGALTNMTDGGPVYERAIAFARLGVLTHEVLFEKAKGFEDWRQVLAAVRSPGPIEPLSASELLVVLGTWIAGGTRFGVEPGAWDHMAELLAPMASGKKADPTAVRLAVWVDLERALPRARTDPAAAKPLLARVLPLLTVASALDESSEIEVGRCNAGLTAAGELGLDLKLPYRAPVFVSRWGWLKMRIPAGTGWRAENATEGDSEMTTLTRVREGRDRVVVSIRVYDAGQSYGTGGSKVAGSNVAGLAEAGQKRAVAGLASVTREPKSLSGGLSKAVPETLGFDVRGTAAGGTPVRLRHWYFRAVAKSKWTFELTIRQEGDFVERDPELQLILDSLREDVAPR